MNSGFCRRLLLSYNSLNLGGGGDLVHPSIGGGDNVFFFAKPSFGVTFVTLVYQSWGLLVVDFVFFFLRGGAYCRLTKTHDSLQLLGPDVC